MGAWIEISYYDDEVKAHMSHPTMGAWIEIVVTCSDNLSFPSHPTMGAWIEIIMSRRNLKKDRVAPHDGCVD